MQKHNVYIYACATLFVVLTGLFFIPPAFAVSEAHGGVAPPAEREVTADRAYSMWRSDPDNIVIVDVRSQPEYAMIGHPPMAYNIPIAFWTGRFDPYRKTYPLQGNPDFVKKVKELFPTTKTILLLCRTGNRSAIAAEILVSASFTSTYNISDGFEGEIADEKKQYFIGPAGKNGWKQAGAPWTYELNSELVYTPPGFQPD